MSQDPAPYTVTPQPRWLRAYLAVHTDPAERASLPWQGLVLWSFDGGALPQIMAAPTWALLSKS